MKTIQYIFCIIFVFYSYNIYNCNFNRTVFDSIAILTPNNQSPINPEKAPFFVGYVGMRVDDHHFVLIDPNLNMNFTKGTKKNPSTNHHIDLINLNPLMARPNTTPPYEDGSFWNQLIYWYSRKDFFFWGPFFENRHAVGCFTSTNISEVFLSNIILGLYGNIENPFCNIIMYHYLSATGEKHYKQCYVSYGKDGCQPLYFDKDKHFALLLATFFPSRVVWDKKIFYTEKYNRLMLEKLSTYISDTSKAFSEDLKRYTNKTALALFLFNINTHPNKDTKENIKEHLLSKLYELKLRIDNNTI